MSKLFNIYRLFQKFHKYQNMIQTLYLNLKEKLMIYWLKMLILHLEINKLVAKNYTKKCTKVSMIYSENT